jgi:undecaprenyl-diphosphatase
MKIKYLLKPKNFLNYINKINLFFSSLALSFFIILSNLVATGKLKVFDDNLLTKIHTILPTWFLYIAKTSYFVGEAEVAVFIVLFSLGFLVWKKYWEEAQVMALSTLSILILIDKILKPFFAIPRPDHPLVENAFGYSFPSGHASGNLLLYFLLAYIFSQSFPKFKVYFYSIPTFLIILMGISSAYLRVHWVTDILASYSIGYIMFSIAITLLKSSKNNEQRTINN